MAKPAQSLSQLRLGRAIRARRTDAGISLASLAADLGIAVSSLSKLENGLVPITFERLERISQSLGVELSALLSDHAAETTREASESGPETARPQGFGSRRNITRASAAPPVEGGVYTLYFHSTDLLEKKLQPIVADVHCTDITDYGPLTRHDGEEFNFVLSGTLEFHTDVYSPVILKAGDSIYFDAEMGHAHIRVGEEPCRLVAVITPRTARTVQNGVAPALEVRRQNEQAEGDDGPVPAILKF
ncbi:MAG TPA: XRE family transcriptional regulator [Caulobacteraceae bacterium]|jgi:transcriptional regulator with XRE-family HTH domain|nr:XRE family transcriptional regulator [Caulobacteraceae bacterium]